MRIVHFNIDDGRGGGSMIAGLRIHKALRNSGLSSKMIVRFKDSDDDDVFPVQPLTLWKDRLWRIRNKWSSSPKENIPFQDLSNFNKHSLFQIERNNVDIISFFNPRAMLQIKTIREIVDYYRKPIVWVLMDHSILTGGCSHTFGCDKFTAKCGSCPLLGSSNDHDFSRENFLKKQKYLIDLPITFVCATDGLVKDVKASALFSQHRTEKIPLPIDCEIFRPLDSHIVRNIFQIPQNKKVILFGAAFLNDSRKGITYLIEALFHLSKLVEDGATVLKKEDIFLLLIGNNSPEIIKSLPFQHQHLGYLKDELTLAMAYQAADVFVCPSIDDQGPMMISESMMCGTPVVAFDRGIAPELIVNMETGYMAKCKDSRDLAHGVYKVLTSSTHDKMRVSARKIAFKRHAPQEVAAKYDLLYRSLTSDLSHNSFKLDRRQSLGIQAIVNGSVLTNTDPFTIVESRELSRSIQCKEFMGKITRSIQP